MEENKQKTGQNIEDIDIIKQFIKIMEQQNRQEQSQDFMEIFRYMAGMQVQLGVMADELQNVRKQLSAIENTQPNAESRKLVNKVSHLQEKISGISKHISSVKNHFVDTVTKSVTAFREKMVDLLTDYEKTANQIDSIGDELKQIGNGFANVGRLVTGKGTKEIAEEKPGVGLTRLINMPIKRNIAALRHHIEKIDRAMNKLDTISAGLEPEEKKTEKGEKPKAKEENQKEKSEENPKTEKTQEKTDKQPEKEEESKGQSEKQAGQEKPQKKAEEKEQSSPNNSPKKDMEKGAEKKERVSVKEKLSEMKAKSEQQKKEPEAAKAKTKEACI